MQSTEPCPFCRVVLHVKAHPANRRTFLKTTCACALGLRHAPTTDSSAKVTAFRCRNNFATDYIEIYAADKNGVIDACFGPATIADSLKHSLGIIVSPFDIHGSETVCCAGLYGLTVAIGGKREYHRLWILMQENSK